MNVLKCFRRSKTFYIDILSTKLKKTELFTKSSNFHVFYCSNELPSLPIGLSGGLKMACAHPRGAVKKLRHPMVPQTFLQTLWVMYYNILEPPKNWRSTHLSRTREV